MKRSVHSVTSPNASSHYETLDPVRDADLLAGLDEVALEASKGNPRAIGAIYIALAPQLTAVAHSVVKHREDAADLVHDFIEALLAGKAARFPPIKGRALAWLEGLLRGMAQNRHRERGEDWGLTDPDYFLRARRFRRPPR